MSAPDGRAIVKALRMRPAFQQGYVLAGGGAEWLIATIDAALHARDAQHAEEVAGLREESTETMWAAVRLWNAGYRQDNIGARVETVIADMAHHKALHHALFEERDALAERVKALEDWLEEHAEHDDDEPCARRACACGITTTTEDHATHEDMCACTCGLDALLAPKAKETTDGRG